MLTLKQKYDPLISFLLSKGVRESEIEKFGFTYRHVDISEVLAKKPDPGIKEFNNYHDLLVYRHSNLKNTNKTLVDKIWLYKSNNYVNGDLFAHNFWNNKPGNFLEKNPGLNSDIDDIHAEIKNFVMFDEYQEKLDNGEFAGMDEYGNLISGTTTPPSTTRPTTSSSGRLAGSQRWKNKKLWAIVVGILLLLLLLLFLGKRIGDNALQADADKMYQNAVIDSLRTEINNLKQDITNLYSRINFDTNTYFNALDEARDKVEERMIERRKK